MGSNVKNTIKLSEPVLGFKTLAVLVFFSEFGWDVQPQPPEEKNHQPPTGSPSLLLRFTHLSPHDLHFLLEISVRGREKPPSRNVKSQRGKMGNPTVCQLKDDLSHRCLYQEMCFYHTKKKGNHLGTNPPFNSFKAQQQKNLAMQRPCGLNDGLMEGWISRTALQSTAFNQLSKGWIPLVLGQGLPGINLWQQGFLLGKPDGLFLGIATGDEAFFGLKRWKWSSGLVETPALSILELRTTWQLISKYRLHKKNYIYTDELIPNLTLTDNFLPST